MTEASITRADLVSLAKNPTVAQKAKTVQKISACYNSGELSPTALKIAEDIFRLAVEDMEIKVREVLSESIKQADNIPKDVVKKLISDTESVAIPFIKFYKNLSHEDLIQIIDIENIEKQKAVALRTNVSEDLSQYIVERCPEEVVGTLVSNQSAKIRERTYHTIVQKYPESDNIKETLVYRPELPVTIMEKIAHSLSEELQKKLITSHHLPPEMAANLIDQVKEKLTLKISEEYSSDKQIEELVHQLYTSNRLTSSLVVRAICTGDLKFFEYALVYLSNTPILEVRKILFNNKVDFMVRNLLRKAFIPKPMFPAVFSALKVIKDIRFDHCRFDRKSFCNRVIERILSVENASEDLNEEDVNYLISKIN